MAASNSNGPLKMMFSKSDSKITVSTKPKQSEPVDSDGLTFNDIPDIGDVLSKGPSGKSSKKLSVERIYQKKSQLEHILLRPDTYIGSVEHVTQQMWVYDEERSQMVQRDITYVPGLYKIFDEILVNAADNKQRDPKGMNTIKIDIDPERNMVKIWNNGKGIPVVEHKTEKMFVPTMIFGHLLTSSNYDDTEKKVTGGRNGYGAKLCNIFSTKFVVETSSKEYHRSFKQVWTDNMSKTDDPKIGEEKSEDFTCVTFYPDLSKFKMSTLDKDIVDLFKRRAYDLVASTRGVKVILNGTKLPIKNFKEYVELYTKDRVDENDQPLKIIHDVVTDRWEVAVTLSEKGFQQVSFVNSVATTKGGRHVDYITDQLISKLLDIVKKKEKKSGVAIKPFQVKNHVWVFVNCLIENPTFDSQTKENMTLQSKSFGSTCSLSEKFITSVSKCGIVEAIQIWMRFKQQTQLNQKLSGSKRSKLRGVPKLDDANDAGTKNSIHCTLILTEGDSAKTLAVAGLGVVGRDRYGVFPLRGKVLNVREAGHKQIMENAEINNIIKILGLQYKEKYDTPESLQKLRYGKLMIMTDQDQDGSHIKGLLINFIHHNWPDLLKQNFLEEFITPIVKVTKNKQEKAFYSLPEFEEWKAATSNWHTWHVKYYKGLGTSTSKEAKEYFLDMNRHRITFRYGGAEDDSSILLAFSKKKIDERKEWLSNFMEERKRRAQLSLPELYLYGKDTKHVSYCEFVNRELILFSNMDNERSIPCLVDGFKPGQRKVLFACIKRNVIKDMKVAQLAGLVAQYSAYHHGEQSLMATIINMAQNYVGSNNINLLQPIGQFGTRLHGGKDAASPRYIFTALSPLARHLFNANDSPLLRHLRDDNMRIEPEWYIPIIPMVLVNGAEGIGTGWSTKIPNYDVREIVANLKRLLDGEQPLPMLPSYKNFRGTIEQIDEERYIISGEVAVIDDQTIEITELPVRTWTQTYKESVLEPMVQGTDKTPAFITDYKEYHTDTTVRFVIKMPAENLMKAEHNGLHRTFKLQTTLSLSSMVLFDSASCIKRYTSVEQILREFYQIRLELYAKRKAYMEGLLAAESLRLDNQARFICEKIDGKITIENKPKKELIQTLVRAKYDSDPVKAWKEVQKKLQNLDQSDDDEEKNENQDEDDDSKGPDFDYILAMQLWSLSRERKDALLKLRDEKAAELRNLRKKTVSDLWNDDLDNFLVELEKVEKQEQEDELIGTNKSSAEKGAARKPKKALMHETKPSPMGRRVQPVIDAAMRAKVDAAAAKKRRDQERKELGLMDEYMDDETEPKPLGDRIGASGDSPVKPKVKQVRKPKAAVTASATGFISLASDSPSKSKKSPKKKGNKRDESSSDELDSFNGDSDGSDGDVNTSFTDLVQRDKAPRRAAANKIKYTFSDDEKSDKGDDNDNKASSESDGETFRPSPFKLRSSDDESSTAAAVKSKPKPRAPAKKKLLSTKPTTSVFEPASAASSPLKNVASDVLEIDSDSDIGLPVAKPLAVQSTKSKKKTSDDDGSDFDFDFGKQKAKKPSAGPKTKKPPAPRKPAASKKPSAGLDGSDDDGAPSKKPKPAAARKPKAAKRPVGSDSSDNDGISKKSKSSAGAARGGAGKKTKGEDDFEFNVSDLSDSVQPRSRPGRAKATVKYNFDTDDENDSD